MDAQPNTEDQTDEAQDALGPLLAAASGEAVEPTPEASEREPVGDDANPLPADGDSLQVVADPPVYDREALILNTLKRIEEEGDTFRDRLLAEAYATSYELQVVMYDVKRFMEQADAFIGSGGGGMLGKVVGLLGRKGQDDGPREDRSSHRGVPSGPR